MADNHPNSDRPDLKFHPSHNKVVDEILGLSADMIWVDDLSDADIAALKAEAAKPGEWQNVALGEPGFFTAEDMESLKQYNRKLKLEKLMSETENNNIHVNVTPEDGRVILEQRHGLAAEIQEPRKVSINGTIEAPAEWFEKRKDTDQIDFDKAHLVVDEPAGTIRLEVDPSSPIGTTVSGAMKLNPLLAMLKINTYGQDKFSEDAFILLLKETRVIFEDQKKNLDLIDKIRNIEYDVKAKVEKADNERGDYKRFYEQSCKTSLPETINLKTHIFEGSKDIASEHTITVEIKFHYSGQLYFWLESPAFHDLYEGRKEKIIGDEVNKFEEAIPIIYV